MWYFYEDDEDEEAEGLGGASFDGTEEEQPQEQEEEEDKKDEPERRKKDKDEEDKEDGKDGDKKDGEEGKEGEEGKDGEKGKEGEKGESGSEGKSPDGKQGEEPLNGDKVKDDLGKKSDELDAKKNGNGSGNGGSNDPTGKTGDGGPKKPGESGGSNPGGKSNMPGGKPNAPGGQDLAQKGGQEATKKATEEAGKKVAAEGAKQAAVQGSAAGASGAAAGGAAAGGAAAGGAAVAAVAWPVVVAILIIIAIIILIIIVVGVICFFVFMPGQVVEKIREIGSGILDTFVAMAKGQQEIVHGEEIANVANYLEQMGYDLKGEGFVTDTIKGNEKQYNSYSNPLDKIPTPYTYDEEQGVYRSDNGDVVAIYSEPIRTYIISDNLCYLLKNANTNATDMGPGGLIATIGGFVLGGALLFIAPAAGLAVIGLTVYSLSGNPDWGSGLISIYHEGSGGIGSKGSFYSDLERGYISLDPDSKQLKIKRGWTNNAYSFDVDGWSGRYGMPLEFLLSVHVATQMPDLAMDMATSFDTDVEVLLHEVNGGTLLAGYNVGTGTTEDNDFITWEQIMDIVQADNNIAQDLWNKFVGFLSSHTSFVDEDEWEAYNISEKEYYVFLNKGLPHADNCSCCSHIPGSKKVLAEGETESCDGTGNLSVGDSFDIGSHTLCKACQNYLADMVQALKKVQDSNWNSYTPYISKVTDHWFRDVYFVIDNIDNTQVAITDEQYFYETDERWSLYETWQENDPDGTPPEGFDVGDYKLYTYENGTYTISKLSRKEADEINAKIEQGDTSVSRLVKKLITKKVSDIKDAEGNQALSGISGNRWVAYKEQTKDNPWTKMEMNDDTDSTLKKYDGKIYYKESRPSDVVQIEDGQRGATNPKIKKMFVENKYYQYDGTVAKADLIRADKDVHNTTEDDIKKNNTADDKRDPELLGKVSITKDSLTAFSMLENTHTLDADYIYKDFKELIVELNYFDKEDLSDKIAEVMTWPLPETGTGGWPVRKYEKSNVFYGTLINSMVDMTLLRQADIDAATAQMEQLKNEDGSSSTASVTPSGKVATGSVKTLVDKGYEVHKIMEDGGGWDYCVIRPEDCTHRYGHSCGLNVTIQEAQAQYHNTCCATYVSWALKEAGFDLSNHPNMHGAKTSYDWCVAEGWTPITSLADMEPGDLLFNKHDYEGSDVNMIGHIQLLGNNGEWLNAGSVDAINDPPKAYTAKFIIGMRSGMTGAKEVFKGYKPNEPVISPLTGKVTEYGEVKRQNVETGEDETVEYIKIEAINQYLYDTTNKGKGYTECKGTAKSETFEQKATDAAKKLEGYDYFYDEYRGVLDGYVLYIEGFDLTLFDSDGAKTLVEGGDTESADVTRYEENEVYNMVDDLEEARAWWKEDAKAFASPLVEVNGDLYIKEGTVIGKTYEDPEDMSNIEIRTIVDADGNEINSCAGNGNYIRLILRNLDDSIVEDVENYLPIEDALISNIEFEQLAYFLGCLEEGFYESADLGDAYGFEVLQDGAGNTTAFGLTSAVGDTVKGQYPDFVSHLQAGRVPKEEAQDVFILVLEAAKEEIEKKANGTLDDNYLFALIDLHHASPACCYNVINIYNANGSLTVQDFEDNWGSNNNYREALMRRGHNRGILATEGRFLLYQKGSEGDEVIYNTETPWTEFCDGGGTYELTTEASGFYTVNKHVDNYTPN